MKTSLLQYFLKCTPLSIKLISTDLAVYVMLKVIFVDADDFFYNELLQLYNILLNTDFLEISIIHLRTCNCLKFQFNPKYLSFWLQI